MNYFNKKSTACKESGTFNRKAFMKRQTAFISSFVRHAVFTVVIQPPVSIVAFMSFTHEPMN